jgi:hypothetical protein
VNMAIWLMIIYAQDMLALRKFTFPAFKRSLCFLHNLNLLLRQPPYALTVMPHPVFDHR